MSDELIQAGDDLATRLREVRDEFCTATDDDDETDLGWLSVDLALSNWRRAKTRETERS